MISGWQRAKLGDVADVGAGNSAPQGKELFVDGSYPFFRTSDIGRVLFGQIFEANDLLNTVGIQKLKKYSAGDILLPKSGASTFLNHRVMLGVDGYVSSHLAVVSANRAVILPKYLLYFLRLIRAQDLIQDHSYPSLKLSDIKSITVSYPPIPEQQRIVAILDQAFANIEKARANTEQNLKNTRELFDSYLNQVFSQRGEGWVDYDLKDIVTIKSGTTVKKELERASGDVAYIKVSGMSLQGNEVEITTSNTFLNHDDINANNVLPLGTTIFPKRGGAIATNKKRITAIPLCIDLNTMGVIPMQGVVLPLYVYFYFKTFDLLSISNGTTIPQINNYSFDGLKVSIPDIEVQKTSIKMMMQIQASTDELSLLYETKLKSLEELKKSLLQKAFSGELTKSEEMVA